MVKRPDFQSGNRMWFVRVRPPSAMQTYINGSVSRAAKGADCKSADFGLRRFESYLVHMKTLIEILSGVHPNMTKLSFNKETLLEAMWAIGILNFKGISSRLIDDETDLFQFIVDIGFMPSKGEIRKLIKNNGSKINNKVVNSFDEIEWINIDEIEFAVIKKGKSDFDFIFKNFTC